MTDLYTIAVIATPIVLGAIRGYTWYRKAAKYDKIVVEKLHEFRTLVDAADDAVQAGTIPSEAAVNQLWIDVLALAAKPKEEAPAAPTPSISTPSA